MQMDEPRVDESDALSALERALRALSLAMGGQQTGGTPLHTPMEEAQ
jgi:hypothetical protein